MQNVGNSSCRKSVISLRISFCTFFFHQIFQKELAAEKKKNLLFIFLLIKCPVMFQSCCLLYNKISATNKFKPAGAVKTSSHFKWFLYLSQFHELK